MEALGQVSHWAGVLALAAFSGTLLGGIALSFFWKNFGPWKLLEACRDECAKCHEERDADRAEILKLRAGFAELNARYAIVMAAVERGGLGLQLGPNSPTAQSPFSPLNPFVIKSPGDSNAD